MFLLAMHVSVSHNNMFSESELRHTSRIYCRFDIFVLNQHNVSAMAKRPHMLREFLLNVFSRTIKQVDRVVVVRKLTFASACESKEDVLLQQSIWIDLSPACCCCRHNLHSRAT